MKVKDFENVQHLWKIVEVIWTPVVFRFRKETFKRIEWSLTKDWEKWADWLANQVRREALARYECANKAEAREFSDVVVSEWFVQYWPKCLRYLSEKWPLDFVKSMQDA